MTEPTFVFIEYLLREAGELAKKGFRAPMQTKAKSHAQDVVTETDIAINEFLVSSIQKQFPTHKIISEEMPEQAGSEWTWLVDPVDGTKNFSTGIPLYGVMIALEHHDELVMAGIYLPELDQLMRAEKGKGCFLNGVQVQCSSKTTLEESMGLGYTVYKEHKAARIMKLTAKHGVMRMNAFTCAAIDGVLVASGQRDWYVSDGAGRWDYAPVALCLREAGCVITTHSGKPWTHTDREMVAANPRLHKDIISALGEQQ